MLTGTRSAWLFKRIRVNIGKPIDPTGRTIDDLVAEGRSAVESLLVPDVKRRGPHLFKGGLTSKRTPGPTLV